MRASWPNRTLKCSRVAERFWRSRRINTGGTAASGGAIWPSRSGTTECPECPIILQPPLTDDRGPTCRSGCAPSAHDGADDPALRRTGDRPPHLPVLHHPRAQHHAQQLQHGLVADAFLHRLHQLVILGYEHRRAGTGPPSARWPAHQAAGLCRTPPRRPG